MNKRMEQIISIDLDIGIEHIRKADWCKIRQGIFLLKKSS